MDYITPDETTDFRKAARDAARALTKDGHSALGDAVLDLWDEYQFALGRLAELEPSREVLVPPVTKPQPFGPLRATYSPEQMRDIQDRINESIDTRRTLEARDSLGTPLRSCLECESEQRVGNDWALRCKKHRGEIRAQEPHVVETPACGELVYQGEYSPGCGLLLGHKGQHFCCPRCEAEAEAKA